MESPDGIPNYLTPLHGKEMHNERCDTFKPQPLKRTQQNYLKIVNYSHAINITKI